MYKFETRFSAYKRGVIYFILYSILLFWVTDVAFWNLKTLFYVLIGIGLSGTVAVFLMSLQYKVEKNLNPNWWILNIIIDIVGYYAFTQTLFLLFTFS